MRVESCLPLVRCYKHTNSDIWNEIYEQSEIPRMRCAHCTIRLAWHGIATITQIHAQPISTYLWIQFPFEPIFIDCFRFLLFQVFPLTRTDDEQLVHLLFILSRRRCRQHVDSMLTHSPLSLSVIWCQLFWNFV